MRLAPTPPALPFARVRAVTNTCLLAAPASSAFALSAGSAVEWHTGDATSSPPVEPRVDFFIDGVYLGTNNAFVPSRGSRFVMSHWWPGNDNWNGNADNWGGGHAGDGKSYAVTSYISSVSVTPFNEPNDVMYMAFDDQPTGCTPTYRKTPCHTWTAVDIPPAPAREAPTTSTREAAGAAAHAHAHAQGHGASTRQGVRGGGLGSARGAEDGEPCHSGQQCVSGWCNAGAPEGSGGSLKAAAGWCGPRPAHIVDVL